MSNSTDSSGTKRRARHHPGRNTGHDMTYFFSARVGLVLIRPGPLEPLDRVAQPVERELEGAAVLGIETIIISWAADAVVSHVLPKGDDGSTILPEISGDFPHPLQG